MAQCAPSMEQCGFVGAVSGMSLADIVQVKGGNRYSGCLVVEHLNKTGVIYFREGEVLHAEQGVLCGEEAFYLIMEWIGGTFRSEPKVSTTIRTIDQPLGYLVLEALRRMDESGAVSGRVRLAGSDKVNKSDSVSEIDTRLKTIPDIEQSLVMTREGTVIGDNTYQAEFMGANGMYLAHFASQLGSQFGLGELKSATVQGESPCTVADLSKRHHLCISAKSGGNVNVLDSQIRQVMSKKAGN